MPSVNTVLGPISAAALGKTLTHEHIFCANETFGKDYSGLDRAAIARKAVILMNELKQAGYATFADTSVRNIAPDPELLRIVSEESGMNIIACVGAYWFYDSELDKLSVSALAGRMLSVIEHGFPGTNVRPGFIKCATQNEITPFNRKMIEAVALAHRESGLPVTTHTSHDTALETQRLLLDAGVDPSRLVIGHTGDYVDVPLHTQLIQNGTFLGMDRSSGDMAMRAEAVASLCRLGYADHLTLSHDRGVFMDFADAELPPEAVWANQDNAHTVEGRRYFLWLDDVLLPAARELGVTEADITLMQIDNPRRFFGGK